MKLLIFTTHFHPYKGGLENYVLQIASRLVKKGVEVDILTFNYANLKEKEKIQGVDVYRIPAINILGGVYTVPLPNKKTKNILRQLSKRKYDIVNTHTRFFLSSWMGMRFAKKNDIPLIHTEHGNTSVKHTNWLITGMALLYDLVFGREIFRSATQVIGVSKSCCVFAKKLGAKTCAEIKNCVDTARFTRKKNKSLRKNISESERIITFNGRLIHAKGVQDLIKSVSGIKNVVLFIAGNGPHRTRLEKLAKQLDIKVKFFGMKTTREIVDILNVTDIFVNPSYSEGLPTSVLEAGSVGVPIIATDVGGTREIIEHEVNGLLVEPKNLTQIRESIIRILSDKKLEEKFRKKVRSSTRRNFSWNKESEKFLKEIKKTSRNT